MKHIMPFLAVLLVLSVSCKNTWNEDDKAIFYGQCMENAQATWPGALAKDSIYCNCVFEKIIKKYPNESDALDHITELVNDSDMQSCKNDVMGK